MEDKELYEILKKYAESTRSDKEVAFKKLNEKPKEEVKQCTQKKFKPRYAFAIAMSLIVIVLCVTLPITLTDKPQDMAPTFCETAEIFYNGEQSIDVLKNNYNIDAYYPSYTEDAVLSISSRKDSSLRGAFLGYSIEENIVFIDFVIIPKTHILQMYEDYFDLPNVQQWDEYEIKSLKEYNAETERYDLQIYFSDSKYDYFVTANSDSEVGATELLDILYS